MSKNLNSPLANASLLGTRVRIHLFALVAAICLPPPSAAEQKAYESVETHYQYAAKVVCSLLTPHQDGDLARGTYRTVINVHNPTEKRVTFIDKVALSGAPGDPPSPFSVTPFEKTTLQPDGAVKFTCGDIAGFFCPINGVCVDFAFLDGFLIIKSPVELDVVGVYTARSVDGDVESVDVETVQPRRITAKTKLKEKVSKPTTKQRIPYPPRPSPDYGKLRCGGIAGFECPTGKECIDDPSDTCDPAQGGADCFGICVDKS